MGERWRKKNASIVWKIVLCATPNTNEIKCVSVHMQAFWHILERTNARSLASVNTMFIKSALNCFDISTHIEFVCTYHTLLYSALLYKRINVHCTSCTYAVARPSPVKCCCWTVAMRIFFLHFVLFFDGMVSLWHVWLAWSGKVTQINYTSIEKMTQPEYPYPINFHHFHVAAVTVCRCRWNQRHFWPYSDATARTKH